MASLDLQLRPEREHLHEPHWNFWKKKMKTAFHVLDTNSDGFITLEDIEDPLRAMMEKLNVSTEKREEIRKLAHNYWINLVNGGMKPSTDHIEVTEGMFLKNVAHAITMPNFYDTVEGLGTTLMTLLGLQNPDYISKEEFMHMYAAHSVHKDKAEEDHHMELFKAMDTDHNERISRDEYVSAVHFFFTDLTNESDARNFVFGPLRTD